MLALLDPAGWDAAFGSVEAAFGSVEMVNLLAIGDCDYDGYFNNFDVDCLIDLLLAGCSDSLLAGNGGESSMSMEADNLAHFNEVAAWLREYVGETCR